ncbi:MAG: hypothetical protein ACK5T5_03010, partial [Phenylobacterium sp.]
FKAAFDAAKAKVRAMEFRYVEETDPIRQSVLEIYCAVALETPFNDFDNHSRSGSTWRTPFTRPRKLVHLPVSPVTPT